MKAHEMCETIPAEPEKDSTGLLMQMTKDSTGLFMQMTVPKMMR